MSNPERLADVGAGGSLFLWVTSHALEWTPILQATSLVVAIIAGTLAAAWHLKKLFGR